MRILPADPDPTDLSDFSPQERALARAILLERRAGRAVFLPGRPVPAATDEALAWLPTAADGAFGGADSAADPQTPLPLTPSSEGSLGFRPGSQPGGRATDTNPYPITCSVGGEDACRSCRFTWDIAPSAVFAAPTPSAANAEDTP